MTLAVLPNPGNLSFSEAGIHHRRQRGHIMNFGDYLTHEGYDSSESGTPYLFCAGLKESSLVGF